MVKILYLGYILYFFPDELASLLSLLVSLVISFIEITQSAKALELELSDIEELSDTNFFKELWASKDEEKKGSNILEYSMV